LERVYIYIIPAETYSIDAIIIQPTFNSSKPESKLASSENFNPAQYSILHCFVTIAIASSARTKGPHLTLTLIITNKMR